MAETEKGKKWVPVPGYTKGDGTKVRPHDRSTPDTAKGKAPAPRNTPSKRGR